MLQDSDIHDIESITVTPFGDFALKRNDKKVFIFRKKKSKGTNYYVSDSSFDNVEHIVVTDGAFGIKTEDNTVYIIGLLCIKEKIDINKSSFDEVIFKFENVKDVIANKNGAIAILHLDETVSTVGDPTNGGNSSSVQNSLTDIERIEATERGFIAFKKDGQEVRWGNFYL